MNQYLKYTILFISGFILQQISSAAADPPLPHAAEKFQVNDHTAILYSAPEPAAGKPWVWYAPALKGGLSLWQRTLYYESFLKAGIAIAGYDLGEVRGSPASTKKFTFFYEAMVQRGFSKKPILLGQSRGGIMMLTWAMTNPDKVGAFVGIYPVCNLASWPLTRSTKATVADFRMSEEEIRAKLKQFNPVDNLNELARRRVPMFIVHGDSDKAVILEENSALLRDRYQAEGGPITLKVIEGEGHRVCPAFFECHELVDFVLARARVKSATVYLKHRPEFRVIYSEDRWIPTRQRIEIPNYPLPAWKFGKDELRKDVYQLGEEIILTNPEITRDSEAVIWKFSNEKLDLIATVTLPDGECPRIDYEVTTHVAGNYTFAYTGGPAFDLDDVTELWQPLVWDGRRLPESSFLMPDDHCSIPGCLVESNQAGTTGVMADPRQFPYEMPHHRNRKFGVTLRSREGRVQPVVFAPFPGTNSAFQSGQTYRFAIRLVHQPTSLTETFEYVARDICGFRDQRENTLCNLNTTLENMTSFALSKWASFDHANKSSYYPDAKGTVKNVSCLHPLGIAMITDEPRFFHEQSVPIMEYLLSREKFLFAVSEEGFGHSQSPTMNLNGPAMPVSELAALYRISRSQTDVFRNEAERLYNVNRMLNMKWVTAGATWQRSLWMYRATGETKWLNDAVEKADLYIEKRIKTQPVDFSEAGNATFFEYMTPWWKDLYELYLDSGEARHLQAAHAGARRYAQFIWFYPAVPDGEITVNSSGLAPRRGRPDEDGLYKVVEETVPNWQVSDQGLLCEGNGTAARLGILIATHAPFFLRIAEDTGDDFLRDIARSAIIGRYANFPGYHLNTRFNTAQEKPDFPLHDYAYLKPTTSIHYNHILPHTNLIIDYLYSRCYDLSNGQIEFPAEYAEGYAYLQGRIYGADSGTFYQHRNVRPWMPSGILKVSDVDVNFVSARGNNGKGFYVAFMNSCDRELKNVTVQLNADLFEKLPAATTASIWINNQPQEQPIEVNNGKFNVSLKPKGIFAIHIPDLEPRVQLQNQFGQTGKITLKNRGETTIADCKVEASVLTFGPGLRWFYAWLRSDQGKPDITKLKLTLTLDNGKTIEQTDDSFPFEFHVKIPESVKAAEYDIK